MTVALGAKTVPESGRVKTRKDRQFEPTLLHVQNSVKTRILESGVLNGISRSVVVRSTVRFAFVRAPLSCK